MKRNSFFGSAGGGPTDVQALGPNPRRKALVITYGGSGNLVVALGKKTQSGTAGDFMLSQNGGALILTHDVIGDSITEEVNIWNNVASQPTTVTEFFTS